MAKGRVRLKTAADRKGRRAIQMRTWRWTVTRTSRARQLLPPANNTRGLTSTPFPDEHAMVIHQPQAVTQQTEYPTLKLTLPTAWNHITNPTTHNNQTSKRQPPIQTSDHTSPTQTFCITTLTYYMPLTHPRITPLPDNTDPPNLITHPHIPNRILLKTLQTPPQRPQRLSCQPR